jgi:hypothetical protein
MFMTEHDPLHALLREWKAPEPTPELDTRIAAAYREAVGQDAVGREAVARPPILRRFWRARVSLPAPVLAVGVLAVLALFLWFRVASPPPPALPATSDLVTHLDATGFQALPDGAARVISVKDLKK